MIFFFENTRNFIKIFVEIDFDKRAAFLSNLADINFDISIENKNNNK